MSTLTVRIPEAKHARLRRLAESRGVSINKLMDELATISLTQHDVEVRFRTLAHKGSITKGLEFWTSSSAEFIVHSDAGSWASSPSAPIISIQVPALHGLSQMLR
jgi:HicB family